MNQYFKLQIQWHFDRSFFFSFTPLEKLSGFFFQKWKISKKDFIPSFNIIVNELSHDLIEFRRILAVLL